MCYVAIPEGAPSSIKSDFRQVSHESIDGRKVWAWSMALSEGESGPTKFYAAQLTGSYFGNDGQP